MIADVRPAPVGRRALRAACLFAVVAGIFGMHGLAAHGVMGSDSMPRVAMARSAAGSDGVIQQAAVGAASTDAHPAVIRMSVSAGAGVTAAVVSVGSPNDIGTSMGMAGLCLAILLVGVGAVSLWLAGHRLAALIRVLPQPVRLIEPKGRVPKPPSLRDLSIQRC